MCGHTGQVVLLAGRMLYTALVTICFSLSTTAITVSIVIAIACAFGMARVFAVDGLSSAPSFIMCVRLCPRFPGFLKAMNRHAARCVFSPNIFMMLLLDGPGLVSAQSFICPIGSFMNETSAQCVRCVAGNFCIGGTSPAFACPAGNLLFLYLLYGLLFICSFYFCRCPCCDHLCMFTCACMLACAFALLFVYCMVVHFINVETVSIHRNVLLCERIVPYRVSVWIVLPGSGECCICLPGELAVQHWGNLLVSLPRLQRYMLMWALPLLGRWVQE
jgi:hypothetical protein